MYVSLNSPLPLCEGCHQGSSGSSGVSLPQGRPQGLVASQQREDSKAAADWSGPVPGGFRVYPPGHWCAIWRCRAPRSTIWTQCQKETDINCRKCLRDVCAAHLGSSSLGLCIDCCASLDGCLTHAQCGGPPGGEKPSAQANRSAPLPRCPPLVSLEAASFFNYPDRC